MAEKSLFYNAFPDQTEPTGYDRNYNGDDLSDWFSIVCDTGVLKGGLQVSAASGMTVSVDTGKATIKGKGYINNSALTLTVDTAPTGVTPRYDMIVLRMDNTQTISARRTYLTYVEGTNSVPTVSNLTRTSEIYDLLLAYIEVQPNVTSITQSNITDTRGDATLCPWFTATKGYDDYYDAIVQQFQSNITLATASATVVTDLPANLYNNKYSIVDVYCNGLKEDDEDYTVATNSNYITITFTQQKTAGAQISVVLSNYIDGEGLSTALDQYTQWVQDVADLKAANEYNYACNGLTDNIEISTLVNAFRAGGTDYSSIKINVIGTFGCTNGSSYANATGGSGTSADPYRIFKFNDGNRNVILDFSNCSQVTVPISGVYASIFDAKGIKIIGLNLVANGSSSGTVIKVFGATSGAITCEDCRFWVNGYSGSMIAQTGTFTNCRGSVSNSTGNSYCFLTADTGIVRINGGQYMAYTGANSSVSAVIGQSATNAVSILYGVSAPTVARSGYYQTNALYQVSTGGGGMICSTDLVTALTVTVVSGKSNIRGTVAFSKVID